MQEIIKHWDFFKRTFLSVPLCLTLAQADLKDFSQENITYQVLYPMQTQDAKEQELCKFICSCVELASKCLMTHADKLSTEDKNILTIVNDFIQAYLLPSIKQEQGDEDLYYATLALSQIITSLLDDVFMEMIGYDEDFIKNFDAIAYGKAAKTIKEKLEHA